ncbi:MAG: hypothetical protein M3Y37_08410 [Chloroflexota bacterium]|nr:hypothetical protein [Chloroflexota bacterium]
MSRLLADPTRGIVIHMVNRARSTCHVIVRSPDRTRILASVLACPRSPRSLDPFVSRLRLDGEAGTVLLVASDSGAILARQRIDATSGAARRPYPDPDDRPAQERLAALWQAPGETRA